MFNHFEDNDQGFKGPNPLDYLINDNHMVLERKPRSSMESSDR